MTKTEQIAAAVANVLKAAGLNVRLDTDALYGFEDFPAIVVDVGNALPGALFGGAVQPWDLSVSLFIGAAGASPKLAPEPTRAAAHAALYADRTLGGLAQDIALTAVNRSIDEENPALGIAEAVYTIKFRQPEDQA